MGDIKYKNKNNKSSMAAIILAAGASRRMGQAKQLLLYQGQTLLSHVINCAIASFCNSVIVILGANADQIEPEITSLAVKIVKNNTWNEGISSSIRCGISCVQEQDLNIDGVVFLTCDQPLISAKIIKQLIEAYNSTNKPIIASQYGKTLGIPVLFSRSFFSELRSLKGDFGAKKIIKKDPDLVSKIDFPQGDIDLDTLADYQEFISRDDLNH